MSGNPQGLARVPLPHAMRSKDKEKEQGIVATPHPIVRALVRWGVRSASDRVLDPAAGDGRFLVEAACRLTHLGASPSDLRQQLRGVEQDADLFREMVRRLREAAGGTPRAVIEGDFFDTPQSQVDVVTGNPPYVRRWWMGDVQSLRDKACSALARRPHRLTDLACYFVLRAAEFLRPGGRLAVVIGDSWLNADYGADFKRFLMDRFRVEAIVGFDHRVFAPRLVRAVMLAAVKREKAGAPRWNAKTVFARVDGTAMLPTTVLSRVRRRESQESDGVSHCLQVNTSVMRPNERWGPYLYAPRTYFELANSALCAPLGELGTSQIGIQTFARSFFIMSVAQAEARGIEMDFLHPIVASPRNIPAHVVGEDEQPSHYVLACGLPKPALRGRRVLRYIEQAEQIRVSPRGRAADVVGVHNLPRLRRANRKPWYNLLPELSRHRHFDLLIPRRFDRRYIVAWNRAGWYANENLIEFKCGLGIAPHIMLALLSSSYGELTFRANAHIYGGGVFNLNPGDIPTIRVLHPLRLPTTRPLEEALARFEGRGLPPRHELDEAVAASCQGSIADPLAVRTALRQIVGLGALTKRAESEALLQHEHAQ